MLESLNLGCSKAEPKQSPMPTFYPSLPWQKSPVTGKF